MKEKFVSTFGMTLMMLLASSVNGQVTLEALDVRGTGIFGDLADDAAAGIYGNHVVNASAVTLNGAAVPGAARTTNDPIDIQLTYSNLDLDGDSTANDSVTFTIHYERVDFDGDGIDGGFMASFGQGIDTGWGNVNDLEVTVTNVSGTTTDSGATIFFDGFTGAAALSGSSGDIDRTVEINGTTVPFVFPNPIPGGFHYYMEGTDFPIAQAVSFDNSGDTDADGAGDGGFGSLVARSFDLQFSLTDPNNTGTLKGDVDLNGMVTFLDINPFIMLLSSNGYSAEADCDCDGDLDFLDIQPFINLLAGTP